MLPQTFCHIHGIGHSTERSLWQAGIVSWDDLRQRRQFITRTVGNEIVQTLEASFFALTADPHFFTSRLANSDHWRIFPHFRGQTAYLDIETTGLATSCEITTIALYDGNTVRTYVNGRNLDDFPDDIETYTVLVTYNGRCFDIPIIERFFRMQLKQAQIDLRYVLARLGCRGGLKGCERQMGINRGLLADIDGVAAIPLWWEFQRYDNEAALETLLAYNIEDTVNLERLMVEAYNRNLEQTPFIADWQLPYPDPPNVSYQPDPIIMDRLRRQFR